MQKQPLDLFKNTVLDSFRREDKVYTLEQRTDKLFLIREGMKTIALNAKREIAEEKFTKLKSMPKGGENTNMPTKEKDGKDKFAETGAKLKAEKAAAEEKAVAAKEDALAALQGNESLAAMYNESASVGSENIGGQSLPVLRVHTAEKSLSNELADGSEPQNGHFYYKPTKEDLGNEIEVHVLTISRGFRTKPMEGSDKKDTFTQLVGGIIGNDKPFIMYFTGTKLQNLWNFGKEAAQYTRRKPVAFPIFSLKVKLTTVKGERGKFGAPWLVAFEIVRNEKQQPVLIMDEGEFQYLKENVSTMEEIIAGVMEATELKEGQPVEPTIEGEAVETKQDPEEAEVVEDDTRPTKPEEEVDPEGIPF